jgi:thymidylate synthase (FAD)
MKIVPISVKLVHATHDPEHVIESMGRICYQSEPMGAPVDFVRKLIKRGHESVIEHVSAGFRIICDRGVSHELVRHRLASFSQESTRYCNYAGERFGNEITVIKPPELSDVDDRVLGEGSAGSTLWSEAVRRAESTYLNLLAVGTRPEIARSVLPNSLKTEIGMTCNAREWRHFLRLRLSPKAHPQMRETAGLIAQELRRWSPVLFEDIGPEGDKQ